VCEADWVGILQGGNLRHPALGVGTVGTRSRACGIIVGAKFLSGYQIKSSRDSIRGIGEASWLRFMRL